MNKPDKMTAGARVYLSAYAVIFTFLFITHAFLLRLPYFWDEAGYFIPAARDLLLTGFPIPQSTLSNAHPPLVMLWLAFWWKFSAFTTTTTREAMLMVAAFALVGLWRLARTVATESVATATVLCTALYPVFFTQSSMAHLDMAAAAFTFWGLAMYVERRPVATIVFLSLAPLAKETAIVTPMAIMAWELLRPVLVSSSNRRREAWFLYHSWKHALSFLICLLPLLGWFDYHHYRTGYYVGNPAFLRYNLGATLSPQRIPLALLLRLWHVFGYLNLFLLIIGALEAMSHSPLLGADGTERPRIAINVQLVFLVVLAANVVVESILGGAVLARYMLPVVPLVILICISTMRRRTRQWTWYVAIAAAAFVVQLFVPPPYRIAPEDTLLYRDYVLLHKRAADELSKHPQRTVLTAWPASDELTRPYLGYVKQPLPVLRIENFSAPEIGKAAHAADEFGVAYLFSTKWEPLHPILQSLTFGKSIQERFFDYHEDLSPPAAAEVLGGRVTEYENRNNEWIGLITIEKAEDARVAAKPLPAALKP